MSVSVFDIIIIVTAVASFYIGMRKGFVRELSSLVSLLIAIYGSLRLSSVTEEALSKHFDFNGIGVVSFCVTLAVLMFLIHMLTNIVDKAVKMSIANNVNKICGGVFCTLRNMFVISTVVCVINYFVGDVLQRVSEEEKERSFTYAFITRLSPTVYPYLDFGIKRINDEFHEQMSKE